MIDYLSKNLRACLVNGNVPVFRHSPPPASLILVAAEELDRLYKIENKYKELTKENEE